MSKKFDFKDLLNFEVMLFPKVARVCYLVIVGISILSGFITFVEGMGMPWGGGPVIIGGLAIMIIGPFFIRLGFEVALILFKVYDRLCDISNKLGNFEFEDVER